MRQTEPVRKQDRNEIAVLERNRLLSWLYLQSWAMRGADLGVLAGVTLFFVVSAFTLTIRSAQDRGNLRSYAIRRLARVGPGYWIAGLLYTLIDGRVWRAVAATAVALAAASRPCWPTMPCAASAK
jgi:peptidoglycan/LPS O-acetylase OafA/YrhL